MILSRKDMSEKINNILLEVNKPSRYIGQEIGSLNKNWDSALVRTVVAFPDLYEIGVSNLGHRILYHLINNEKDFIADRVYAPAVDFKQKLTENQILLYGVESFKALHEFDVVAFSLQYELSYPTILAMLEMGKINIKSAERPENSPIIIGGGPGCYNPEPLADFIDVFIIGDGEEIIIELLNEIKNSKLNNFSREKTLDNLQKIEGIYVPKFYRINTEFSKPQPINNGFPEKINRRIFSLKDESYPVNFPVPYMQVTHDRAVIEIRRGCSRMCRFCQSCFVNLPVRERPPESIIDLTGKILKNTGYDEYSLLSLSSSDYGNIEDLVCILNQNHAESGASISLPSQRADAFSLELANQVQSVRKSTLTFAPEAGSQRLRDAVNKNLSEEQIINAVLSAYKSGWSKIKLYFMIGLPTETFEDLDEIINLLQKIKNTAGKLKSEMNIPKHPDLTCTISIFVPKPFTPFQWCAQDSFELINEKIRYLKEKIRHLKGVKLNFHDSFLSLLEAVFARGDRELCKLIEHVYRKGSYLDAWNEHFNKKIWHQAAEELNIDLEKYSSKKICLESELPWDIINTGIDKNWLKNEFNKSLENQTSVPCSEFCASCGICDSLKRQPEIKSIQLIKKDNIQNFDQKTGLVYRYRLRIQKTGNLKYISHLDWQRMIYRAIRKADIKIDFSKGFNPSPKISIGMALPLFIESFDEYIDIEIKEEMQSNSLMKKLNEFLPENSRILNVVKISKEEKVIDIKVNWAKYSAVAIDADALKEIDLKNIINDVLLKEEIFIEKQNYKRHKDFKKVINIRPYINSLEISDDNFYTLKFVLKTGQNGMLRPDDFLKFLTPDIRWNIIREKLLDCDFKELA